MDAVSDALAARNESAITAARRSGLPRDAIRSLFRGRSPSLDRAEEICRALGITLTLGPPRPRLRSVNDPPKRASFTDAASARKGLDPVSDRALAEILGAICAHFDELGSDYARRSFIDQLYAAGGPALRAQGSGLTRIVAWLGWQVIEGGAAPGKQGEDE